MRARKQLRCRVLAVAFSTAAVFLCGASAHAGDTDEEQIRDRVEAFFKTVDARDIDRMAALWDTTSNVTMLTPNERRMAIGWPAVKRAFGEGVFTFWNRLKAAPQEPPLVLITGSSANALFLIEAAGEDRAGHAVRYWIHTSQIYQKHGDQWKLIGFFADGAP